MERIDDLCAEFERKWQADQSPSIESVLTEDISPEERDVLLAELVALDVDYRRRRSENPSEQDYLNRFPDSVSIIHDALRGND
ncbi:MAG: serine/threonine protein kinase, partial [Rhodopirellula bahusiensis]